MEQTEETSPAAPNLMQVADNRMTEEESMVAEMNMDKGRRERQLESREESASADPEETPGETRIDATEQLDDKVADDVDKMANDIGLAGPMPNTTAFNTTRTDQEILDEVFKNWSANFSSTNAPEVEKWTVDDYRERYAANVTNGYNMVRLASGLGQEQYATFGVFPFLQVATCH